MKSQCVCAGLWLQVTHLSPVLTRGRSWGEPPLLCLLLSSKQHRKSFSTPLIDETLRLPVRPALSRASHSHGQAEGDQVQAPNTC